MECTEGEAALRSKVRTTRRVTRVIALNASAARQTSIDLTASCSINLPPKVLITINYKILTVSYKSSDRHHIYYVTDHSVFTITILALLCHRSCISIRRPMNIEPSWLYWPSPQLTVCTKATDQMGWRGQLKRIKIGDKDWRAQRVHVHGPKDGRAHFLCGVPGNEGPTWIGQSMGKY